MDLILAAVAPAVLLLVIFYTVDRYNREPLKLLLTLFVLGMVSVIPILIVEIILDYLNVFRYFDTDLMNLYDALVVAGFTEELFKWLIVMLVAFRHKEFDEYLDGIIYCVYVSLGFATVENVLYVLDGSYYVAALRAVLSVPAHMLFGVTMGYYLSLAKFSLATSNRRKYFTLSILMPILLHGFYDYILMTQYTFLIILLIPFMIWLWVSGIKRLKIYYNDSKFRSMTNGADEVSFGSVDD